MIGLNRELEEYDNSGRKIRIGLVGAGQMGTDVVAETTRMKGMEVVCVADIDLERARNSFTIAGISDEVVEVNTAIEADAAVAAGKRAVTKEYRVVTDMSKMDVMVEATGAPDIGARATLRTFCSGRPVATMNVETDITVGPILRWFGEQKGMLYAMAAGDEPSACIELYDFATALGFTIVAAGKGKNNPLDRCATPHDPDLAREAARRGLSPNMLVEFIDGSKTMIEMASVSNATGLVPDIRGMHGPETNRDILHKTFSLKEHGGVLTQMGVVDFGVGRVAPGVFLIIYTDHPRLQEAMVLRDMGNGPYYTLFRPYHLCSIEVPLTCAMLVLRKQSNMQPLNRLVSEVFAVAKQDLMPGDMLDGIGGACFYSLIDTYEKSREDNLLPIGLAKGAKVVRPVQKNQPITYSDVEVKDTTVYKLRQLQDHWLTGNLNGSSLLNAVNRLADV